MDQYSNVEGDEDDMVTEGEDVLGDLMGAVSALPAGQRRQLLARAAHPMLRLPPKPGWRHGQLAPGAVGPYQGLEPLPLTPLANGGVFTPLFPSIEFRGQPQRPFRGERLLADIRRSAGALGVGIVAAAIFVGTKLQSVDVGSLSLDFFTAQAFGVRLSLMPATPGMIVRIIGQTTIAVPAGETVAVNLVILGRTIS